MSHGNSDDVFNTEKEVLSPSRLVNGKNWLRHSGQAEKIDEMLLTGATVIEIAQELVRTGLCKRDVSLAVIRVKNHLYHLGKGSHNVMLACDLNGVWRFVTKQHSKQY